MFAKHPWTAADRQPATSQEAPLKFSPSSAATGTLLFAGLAALFVCDRAEAQVARPLAAEQVACSADQLRAILGRSALLFGPFFDERTAMFLFTFGAPSHDLAGLGLLEQSDRDGQVVGPERQLAFTVSPGRRRPLRNPERPELNSIVLLRDPLGSDLGFVEDPFAMAVVLDPTVDPLKNEDPASLLVIDNIKPQEGGVPSDSKAGRALMAILGRCRNDFTAADLHAFDVLSRVVRAMVYTSSHPDPGAGRMHKLASIYRGEGAEAIAGGVRATYRIDLYPVAGQGKLLRISLEMKIDLGDDGALGDATLRVLPACTAEGQRGCTSAPNAAEVSVIHPETPNRVWSAAAPTVCWHGGADCPEEVSFSFAERLQGTTWLRP
jgi:hypothetical protein